MSLAIAVMTYNRAKAMESCYHAIHRYKTPAGKIIIADDGSDDDTVNRVRGFAWGHVRVITGPRRGSMGNRNRALFCLMHYTSATTFIILEDDCHPNTPGWEAEWVKAAHKWGHVTTAWAPGIVSGAGTADDPYLSDLCGMQCVALTRAAALEVGYSDPRFVPPYGHADTDWRWRYGTWNGTRRYDATLGLRCGLDFPDYGTWRDEASVAANEKILRAIRDERPLYRHPWKDAAGNLELVRECLGANR